MDGKIKGKAGNTPNYVGVFFGWCTDATNLMLKNSVSMGTCEGIHIDLAWKNGNSVTASCPVSNTYYEKRCSFTLGKFFNTISTQSTALTLKYVEPGDTYSVSGITVYEDAGLMFGNQRIAGQNEVLTFGVIPADGFSVQNVQASSGTLVSMPAADTEVYHLTMGAEDVVVRATVMSTSDFVGNGTEANPYLIGSSPEWVKLAIDVENGTTYSGKVFRLTNNIDTEGMPVGTEEHPNVVGRVSSLSLDFSVHQAALNGSRRTRGISHEATHMSAATSDGCRYTTVLDQVLVPVVEDATH